MSGVSQVERICAWQWCSVVIGRIAEGRGLRGRLPISTRTILTFRCAFSARMTLVPQLGRFLIYQQGPREENGFSLWRSKLNESSRIDFGVTKRKDSLFPGDGPSLDASSNQISPHLSCLLAIKYSRAWSHFTKTRFPRRRGLLRPGGWG